MRARSHLPAAELLRWDVRRADVGRGRTGANDEHVDLSPWFVQQLRNRNVPDAMSDAPRQRPAVCRWLADDHLRRFLAMREWHLPGRRSARMPDERRLLGPVDGWALKT
jgi:hypothetical protein